ncbi:MAG: DUF1285 domain-containing protein [Halioglobus sp.]
MDDQLQDIEQQVGRNYDSPPLHLWSPELSGDIDIRIDADGRWFHEGSPIERAAIVRVFASILRREEDGCYYLVTPGEKWRIQVDLLPLVVTDVDRYTDAEHGDSLRCTLNTGRTQLVNAEFGLFLESRMDNVAALHLPHGLAALFTRSAWYRLVAMAVEKEGVTCIESAGETFPLEAG